MKTEIEKITSLLTRTFEKTPWYGPSVQEVLSRVVPESAALKLPHTHSVIELVAHMTSWRKYVIHQLQGAHAYTVTDSMNFPQATDWNKVKAELQENQEELLKAIAAFPAEKLSELVPHPTYRYTYYTLIHGVIHHDIYHIGQISLILKATA